MSEYKYRPRITVEITPRQRDILDQYLAHGEQRRIFETFLEDMTTLLAEFGHHFIAYMLERQFSYRTAMEHYIENRRLASEVAVISDIRGAVDTDTEYSGTPS